MNYDRAIRLLRGESSDPAIALVDGDPRYDSQPLPKTETFLDRVAREARAATLSSRKARERK